MDPITLVTAALIEGLRVATSETAGKAIKDLVYSLKSLLTRKFKGNKEAENTLMEFEKDPETYEKPFMKALLNTNANNDDEILKKAHKLLQLVNADLNYGTNVMDVKNYGKVKNQTNISGSHVTLKKREKK